MTKELLGQESLIYLYINKANGSQYGLHLDFSRHEKIRWNEHLKKFTLNKDPSYLPSEFFPENISNVTVIAGKNGSGKTTILDILKLYRLPNLDISNIESWIAIYKINPNRYFLEGRGEISFLDNILKEENKNIISGYNFFLNANMDFLDEDSSFSDQNMGDKIGLIFIDDLIDHDKFQDPSSSSKDNILFRYKSGSSDRIKKYSFLNENKFMEPTQLGDKRNIKISINESSAKSLSLNLFNLQEKDDELRKIFDPNLIAAGVVLTTPANNPSLDFKVRLIDAFLYALLGVYFASNNDVGENFNRNKIIKKIDSLKKYWEFELEQQPYFFRNHKFSNLEKIKEYLREGREFVSYLLRELDEILQHLRKRSIGIFDFEGFYTLIDSIDEDYFKILDSIPCLLLPYGFGLNVGILEKLDYLDIVYNNSFNIIECSFGDFSSGEKHLINQFSILDLGISRLDKLGYKQIVFFIDEFEISLHPEWSRIYLSKLISFLSIYKSLNIQIVLTTHSPYLISDLPKENIILIEKNEKTGERTTRKSKYGFASNYYDIMSDSFFLDDTIGEFAKQKIDSCIDKINKISDKCDSYIKDNQNEFNMASSLGELDDCSWLIKIIGDPFIQEQLLKQLNSVKEKLLSLLGGGQQRDILAKERDLLEARIKQINKELGDD